MTRSPLEDYFRCPPVVRAEVPPDLNGRPRYFSFRDAVGYGRLAGASAAADPGAPLVDISQHVSGSHSGARLPFDLAEVITNLREERYQLNGYNILNRASATPVAEYLYYLLRPILGVALRKHLQKIRLSGWDQIQFPRWPVDVSVDCLMRHALGLVLERNGGRPIPFIWFWPDGADSAAMVTHDVEGDVGHAFCDRLMDLDERFGIKAAFQLIPEGHADTWRTTAERLRRRGFEVNLHDYNHDGYLFRDRSEFLRRARRINEYAREFGCRGFRSGAMYREQAWYDAFEFSYDMSVPNVAHLEPQRGGCCTVMPYFVGDILELPLTTIQDYSLFHILGDYSIDLWRRQIEVIRAHNGLIALLSHPDYLTEPRAMKVYTALLEHLATLRRDHNIWVALPGEINTWWRHRHQMRLMADGSSWRIEGPGREHARVAYVALVGGEVVFSHPTNGHSRGESQVALHA